jgi:uncharacterized protein YybS (DUF2232 family)
VGIFLALFSGVPLALAQISHHRQQLGLGAMVLSGGLVEILGHSPLWLIVYLAWAGMSGVLTGELVRRHYPISKIVGLVTLQIAGFSSFIVSLAYFKTSGHILQVLQKSFLDSFHLFMGNYLKNSPTPISPSDMILIKQMEPQLFQAFLAILPGFLLSGIILTAFVQVSVVDEFLLRKSTLTTRKGISRWYLPDYLVFVFIIGLVLVAIPNDLSRTLGVNLLLIVGAIYIAQGAGVITSYTKSRSFGLWFWIVTSAFILIQPLILVMLSIVGILDVWMDFRKLRPEKDPTGESG